MTRYVSHCAVCHERIRADRDACQKCPGAATYMRLDDYAYLDLLAQAKATFEAMTPEQQAAHRREQAIDFAYGNVKCDGHGGDLTLEDFARIYDEMHLPGEFCSKTTPKALAKYGHEWPDSGTLGVLVGVARCAFCNVVSTAEHFAVHCPDSRAPEEVYVVLSRDSAESIGVFIDKSDADKCSDMPGLYVVRYVRAKS